MSARKKKEIRLGYAGVNSELRLRHIFTGRTCRAATLKARGIEYALELMRKNLEDLLLILEWNESHNIRFYRIGSDFAPHITDEAFMTEKQKQNYKSLAYDFTELVPLLRKVGNFASASGHRLTFHPDLYLNLSSPNKLIAIRSMRDMWFHATIMNSMGLGASSVMVLHGGGAYGNKAAAARRWIARFKKLPLGVRSRVVLENDEFVYGIDDILAMSNSVKPAIPVVLDIFHHSIYDRFDPNQTPLKDVLPLVAATWGHKIMKLHISEQNATGPVASHSDFVKTIPHILLEFFKTSHLAIDLMVEAKAKERAVFLLRKKYRFLS